MEKQNNRWSKDAFDAISFMAMNGDFEIEGIDGEQVELYADGGAYGYNSVSPQINGRWLQFSHWGKDGSLVLRLPQSKPWVIRLSASRGKVKIRNISTRLQILEGKGDIEIESCQGQLNLFTSHSQVKLLHFKEIEIPEVPLYSNPGERHTTEPTEEGFASGFAFGNPMPDFLYWEGDEWGKWGEDIAEQAVSWASQFGQQFVNQDWEGSQKGIKIRMHRGDMELKDVQADYLSARTNNGNFKFNDGLVKHLQIKANHGGVELQNIFPAGDWTVGVTTGDIHVDLPADSLARLDIASRDGDIKSNIPLVRVARPGPEARRGGRMVGNVGQASSSEKCPQLSLAVVRGDVKIGLSSQKNGYKPAPTSYEPSFTQNPGVEGSEPNSADAGVQSGQMDEGQPDENHTIEDNSNTPIDTRLDVLNALQSGKISVDEADQLLRRLTV